MHRQGLYHTAAHALSAKEHIFEKRRESKSLIAADALPPTRETSDG